MILVLEIVKVPKYVRFMRLRKIIVKVMNNSIKRFSDGNTRIFGFMNFFILTKRLELYIFPFLSNLRCGLDPNQRDYDVETAPQGSNQE